MLNYLMDVSIKTMIGQLPMIINHNSSAIEKEFANIYDDISDKIIKSIYAPTGSVKAYLGEFINLHVDYLNVNNVDSLLNSLSKAPHNSFLNRFSINNPDFLTDDTKNTYAHDAKTIIYDINEANPRSLYEVISNMPSTQLLSYGASNNLSVEETKELLDESVYSLNMSLLSKKEFPKWKKSDILSGLVYTYYTGGNYITIDDKHICSIDGYEGEIKTLRFDNTHTYNCYRILLSRKDKKYLLLSKDELVRVKLVCISNTDQYGAEWDLDSYSVRNSTDIEIQYK